LIVGVTSLATRRLVDATAQLDPADRALLNLWVNRGLPDDRLTVLTRLSAETLAARRQRIVRRLAETLGLPDETVAQALAELTPGLHDGPGSTNGTEGDDAPSVSADAAPPAASGLLKGPAAIVRSPSVAGLLLGPGAVLRADGPSVAPAPAAQPRRRGRLLPALLGLLVLIVAAIVVALASGEGASPRHATTPTPRAGRSTRALTILPGGPAHAGGSVAVARSGPGLTLDLTVSSLPGLPSGGAYEAWLYNSVLDSAPLGAIPGADASVRLTVPAGAGRYRWIDISLQPRGTVGHSGISLLRAPNPLQGR
jgi:hypothetical protein